MIEWGTVIGTYGFPIAVTIYLLWERTHVIRDLNDKAEEASKALTLAVNELTTVIRERVK